MLGLNIAKLLKSSHWSSPCIIDIGFIDQSSREAVSTRIYGALEVLRQRMNFPKNHRCQALTFLNIFELEERHYWVAIFLDRPEKIASPQFKKLVEAAFGYRWRSDTLWKRGGWRFAELRQQRFREMVQNHDLLKVDPINCTLGRKRSDRKAYNQRQFSTNGNCIARLDQLAARRRRKQSSG